MAGALKTLFGALQASQFMSGVTMAFGEEYINAQDQALPYVVMVPVGGPIDDAPGYIAGLDPNVELAWGISEQVDFYLWAHSSSPTAQPIDHADAVETLRQLVLSALRDQRAQYVDVSSVSYGLVWQPIKERWQLNQNALDRYGRCLVIETRPLISVPMAAIPGGPETTITSTQQTDNFIDAPSG